MTKSLPPTSSEKVDSPHGGTPACTARSTPRQGAAPALVVFVTASWAATCRPSRSVVRELARKYAQRTPVLTVEDPTDQEIDLLGVEMLPFWIAVPAPATPSVLMAPGATDPRHTAQRQPLRRESLAALVTEPEWKDRTVLVGAHPKHAVASRIFGDAPLR